MNSRFDEESPCSWSQTSCKIWIPSPLLLEQWTEYTVHAVLDVTSQFLWLTLCTQRQFTGFPSLSNQNLSEVWNVLAFGTLKGSYVQSHVEVFFSNQRNFKSLWARCNTVSHLARRNKDGNSKILPTGLLLHEGVQSFHFQQGHHRTLNFLDSLWDASESHQAIKPTFEEPANSLPLSTKIRSLCKMPPSQRNELASITCSHSH